MFKFLPRLVLVTFIFASLQTISNAQLTGIKNIPGDYATVSLAVTDLNTQGVGPGGVIFNVAAGYTETIASTISITATGTLADPITFQKSGAGANPLITSYTGGVGTPGTAVQDGIWNLVGTDYITIDGIDLMENAANSTNPATMEYGYALYKASGSNGCQNVTIRNCTITLNRINNALGTAPMTDGSNGIVVMNATPTAATSALVVTATGGSNSFNRFYANTIQNCNIGISMIGYNDLSPFTFADQSNDIGGLSILDGNIIRNFGGGGTNASAGIRTQYQYSLNISYNTVNSNDGGGVNHIGTLRGIYLNLAQSASSTISFNTVSVKGGGTTQQVAAIENASGSTAAANTVNINNNTISNCTYTTATSGVFYGIYNSGATPSILKIHNNSFTANSTAATSGSYYPYYNTGGVVDSLIVTNNSINGCTFTAAATSAVFRGIYASTANAASTCIFRNNSLQNINYSGTATAIFSFIYNAGSANNNEISNNTITSLTIPNTGTSYAFYNSNNTPNNSADSNVINGYTNTGGAGTTYLYYNLGTPTGGTTSVTNSNFSNVNLTGTAILNGIYLNTAATNVEIVSSNTLNNLSTGTGTSTGIYVSSGSASSLVSNNTISNFSGAGALNGIQAGATATTGLNITGNTIHTLSSTGVSIISGILNAGGVNTIQKNKIYNLTTNTTTGSVYGISITAGTLADVYNNLIGDLKAPVGNTTADQIRGISITSTTINSTRNIYYNSIYLNATSGGTNFSSTGIYHTTSTTATTSTLNLNNNIIVNVSTPNGTGISAAYRRSNTTLTNFGTGSNNNLFYAGTPGPANVIMHDGTTGYQTMATYIPVVTPRDTNSITENPPFLSIVGASANFLHLDPLVLSGVSNGAENIGGITDDYDGDIRFGNIGYVGGGSAPDIGADEYNLILALDMGVSMLLEPGSLGCHTASDTIRLRINNYSNQTINFALNPVTVTSNVTGVNPQVFPVLNLNSDTLTGFGFIDTTIFIGYNMTALGSYTFNATATVAGDGDAANNSMTPVTITISGGTVSASDTTGFCAGELVDLSVTGQTPGGSIQWQQSTNGGMSWTNISGATTTPYSIAVSDTTWYRAEICGTNLSDSVLVIPSIVEEPVANDVTRCGPGSVTLTATSNGPISWYDAPVGGALVDTGNTINVNVVTTTNFYPEASSGTGPGQLDCMPLAGGNGCGGGVMFAVTPNTNLDITGFIANLGSTAGTPVAVGIYYKLGTYVGFETTAGAWTFHETVNVIAAGPNNPSSIPISSLPLLSGQMYGIFINADMDYTNVGGPTFFSNAEMTAQVGSGLCGLFTGNNVNRGFNGSIIYGTGCISPRDTVTVTVTPSDTIIANVVTNPICSNASTVINVNSINPDYQYTWSPSAGLSGTTGSSVTTTSDTSITYLVTAIDTSTDCEAFTYASVTVLEAPTVNITTPDTSLCINSTLQINGTSDSHITFNGDVGLGVTTNTATSTTILGPYGGLYGGARHQYLVLGTELQGAGLTAGPISEIAFDVANLNSIAPLADYVVKIDTTTLTALTTSYAPVNNTVYFNPSFMPTLGWNGHPFSTNFLWDGVSNIIVEVCFNNVNAGSASGNASVRYTNTTGTNTVNYYRADSDPNVCAMLSGTPSINRPNMRFSTVAPVSYQWGPVTGLSNDTIIDPLLTAISTNTYTITVTDDVNGCTETDNIDITVIPLPVFTIGNDTAVCSNIATTPFGIFASDNTLNYLWFDGSTNTGTLVSGPGTYWATGTNAGGCSSTDTMVVSTVDPATVDINIDITGTNTADLDAGAGYTSYLWSTSQSTQMITITANGTYWVQITDANGCPNTDTISIIFSLGIDDMADGQLLFYPNPSTGMINMAGTGLNGDPLKLEIMDISGQMIYQQNIQEPGETFIEQIDLSMVAEGTYIIRVTNKNKIYTSRIIIARK